MARYGGEEFAVILPNTEIEGAISVAQTIRQAVRNLTIPHAGSSVCDRITVSLARISHA
jgi:diguanylate cyclase (GGDEF)-like protein